MRYEMRGSYVDVGEFSLIFSAWERERLEQCALLAVKDPVLSTPIPFISFSLNVEQSSRDCSEP